MILSSFAIANAVGFLSIHRKWFLWGFILLFVMVGSYCGVSKYRQWQEDKTRQAIAEAVTRGLESEARTVEIEKEVENLGIQLDADIKTVEAAKDAMKEARQGQRKNVTAEDIERQLQELGL